MPSRPRRVQIGQLLADAKPAWGRIGFLQRQSARRAHRLGVAGWLESAATIRSLGAVLAESAGVDLGGPSKQGAQRNYVGEDQEQIESHWSPQRYWIGVSFQRLFDIRSEIGRELPSVGMRRFMVPGLITCAAVALLVVLATGVASQGSSSSLDAQVARGRYPVAPGLHASLPLLSASGKESLAALHGKVVLLNVFASWCQPCAAEAPLLERAQHLLRRHDGTVLGVTYLDNAADSKAFMRHHHLTYPAVRDVSGNFVRSYGVNGVPETFVINRAGRVEALNRAQLTAQWLNQTLAKILDKSS